MKNCIKKGILFALFSFTLFLATAEQFRIASSYYISSGITKSSALQRTMPLDTKRTFNSEEELTKYLDDIVQQLMNLRLLENISYHYEYLEAEGNCIPVSVTIMVSDSKHFVALPNFSYDSNSGVELKLKIKDTNFLGNLNTLNFDFNGELVQESEKEAPQLALGINFDYELPFTLFNLANAWSNDFSFSWILGKDYPEFNYTTGLSFEVPLGQHGLDFSFKQSIKRDEDYLTYGDDLYAVENASISLPLTIGRIKDTTKVVYTPSINFIYNWDSDGINPLNEDLSSPILNVAQGLATSRVNWKGNFRDGFFLSGSQSFGWNFQTEQFVPGISSTIDFYKAFKYAGICSQFYAFGLLGSSNSIGTYLRGIRDNQTFADGSYYALKVPAALVFSLDLPVHIITTHWMDWGYAMFGSYDTFPKVSKVLFWIPHKLFKYLDFEMQLSPFIDMALTRNRNNNTTFSYKDGFYAAGMEVLVYPSKWPSFVVRGSVGFDVGRKFLANYLNMSWRDASIPKYEIYFGLGLNY